MKLITEEKLMFGIFFNFNSQVPIKFALEPWKPTKKEDVLIKIILITYAYNEHLLSFLFLSATFDGRI